MSQLENILKGVDISTRNFPPTSRYYGIGTKSMEKKDGESVVYMRRRFIPQSERFSLIREHTVTEGDRLDNLASEYLGDPEQFWQICDANDVLHPDDLTEIIGAKIRITLPADIPGNIHA